MLAPISPNWLITRIRALDDLGEIDRQRAFWLKELESAPRVMELPSDLSRPRIQDGRGARLPFSLDAAVTAAVRAFARRLDVTPFTALLASYGVALARYCGEDRFIVGVPVSGRLDYRTQRLIAPCLNFVPIVLHIRDDDTVAAYVTRIRTALAAALCHADVPFNRLVHALQIPPDGCRTPVVQFAFGMHDQLIPPRLDVPGLDVTIEEGHAGGSPFDLTLYVQHSQPVFSGVAEFSTGVLAATEVSAFLNSFIATLDQMAHRDDQRLADVRGITPEQQRRLRQLQAQRLRPATPPVDHLFARQASETPDAVAVRGENDQELTYRQLAHAADIQAHLLQAAGVRPGDRVAVSLPRSVAEIVALLGVLRAAAAYVAVDAEQPIPRLKAMLQLCRPRAVLADPHAASRIQALGACPAVDTWQPTWPRLPAGPVPRTRPHGRRIAYIAFTSGSTGTPKAVVVPHRSVVRLAYQPAYVRSGPGERFLRFAPLGFDASTLEVWAPLLNGGTVEIGPAALPAPTELARSIRDRGVTVLWLTSGLFRLMVELCPEAFSGVKQVLTGGDVVSATHVRALLERFPQIRVTNGYGPTENTTFTAVHHVDHALQVTDPLPIGRPIPGTSAYILDKQGRLLPPGAIGELYVGGDGLAHGYAKNPKETAHSFGRLSPDVPEQLYRTGDIVRLDGQGQLQFLGRRDHQVKVRGYRVDLDEVRHVLVAHANVSDAVVTTVGESSTDRRLLAAVVPRGAVNIIPSAKNYLARRLPSFMLPSLWVEVDQLPLTPNGKIDRQSLETLATLAIKKPQTTEEAVQPKTSTAEMLLRIWADSLQMPAVGMDDSLFDLGGHSLIATQMIARIQQATKHDIPLAALYLRPTVRAMASFIDDLDTRCGISHPPVTGRPVPIAPARQGPHRPVTYNQAEMLSRDITGEFLHPHNITCALRLSGTLDSDALVWALTALIERHEALRARFHLGATFTQSIAPARQLDLRIVNLRALHASKRWPEALRQAETVAGKRFEIDGGLLLRPVLYQIDSEDHLLLLVMDHLVSDGWSIRILLEDLGAAYTAAVSGQYPNLPPLTLQFADYAKWEQDYLCGPEGHRLLKFWRDKIDPAFPLSRIDLPFARSHPQPLPDGAKPIVVELPVSAAVRARLRHLMSAERVTPFTLIVTAVKLTAFASGASEDLSVATHAANRRWPDTERLIGLFANSLVLRSHVRRDMSVREALHTVGSTILDAQAHQELPFGYLTDRLGLSDRIRINAPYARIQSDPAAYTARSLRLPDLTTRPVSLESGAMQKSAIVVELHDTDERPSLWAACSPQWFDETSAEALIRRVIDVLERIVDDPETPLCSINR